MEDAKKYMFDTNVFNRIFDHEIEEEWFPSGAQYFITHVQSDELDKTPDPSRRAHLRFVMLSVGATPIPTTSAMWGLSEFGGAEFGSDDGLFENMLASLNARNGEKENNGADILIAETAIRHGCCLVTDDKQLAIVVREFYGRTMTFSEFETLSEK